MLDIVGSTAPLKATDTTHRQLSWFAERVEKGRAGLYSEVVTITPEIAKRLLEVNDANRPINERLVAEILTDIESGSWVLNGESIVVSKEGLLNDGQHRLEAIVRAQTPVQSVIVFGASREGRMTVDMGRPRTAGNFLAMGGAKYANHAASVAKLLMLYESNIFDTGRGGPNNPTKQAVRKYHQKHKKEITAAIELLKGERFTAVVGMTPLAAAAVILDRTNKEEAAVFFSRALTGANLKDTDPILWLRTRFMDKNVNLKSHEKLETILRYWNAWRIGRKLTQAIKRDGAYPKVQS